MTLNDEQLYERVQSNDKDALKILYRKYEKLLYTYAYKMTSDFNLAEEVVQDVFLKVWQKKDAYKRDRGTFATWLITLTRNSAIDQLRKKKVEMHEYDERDSMTASDKNQFSPIELKVLADEDASVIGKAIENLNEEQQKIIELFYFKAFSQSQIASEMNIPLGTVKSRLRLAVQHLKRDMHINQKGGAHNENA